MVTKPNSKNTTDKSEHEFAVLVTEILDRVGSSEQLDLATICRQHPQYEEELRELWGTIVVTDVAAQEQLSSSNDSLSGEVSPQFELPYQFGDYVLEEEIGRGGMGIVYRATRRHDQKPVAIKMLLKGDFASEAERERFNSESIAAGKLDHPNIISIYDSGEHQGRAFFCMQLIHGQSLSERLALGPMTAKDAAVILEQVSAAINFAHQNGVLHRDIKPSNIMLDRKGKAFVADFGLAKQSHGQRSITGSSAIIGTPSYMSPEQASGNRRQVGVSSDVYSLGAILYHMLTGRPPFLGSSPVETVMLVLEQDPVGIRALNRHADRRLEMIAMRCLQKPRDLRYPTAEGLNSDLRAFLRDDPLSASEGRFTQIVGKFFRETHHAVILENWGLLWVWHSLVLLVASISTNVLFWLGDTNRVHYWLMWTFGLGAWAIVFWLFRRRMGSVTFVERQIAHVWAAAMGCVAFLFPLEALLGMKVLSLAPMLAITAAMVFLVKAGILSGTFYIQAMVMLVTAIFMAMFPNVALIIFGFVSAACFFFPGLKYHRQRQRTLQNSF